MKKIFSFKKLLHDSGHHPLIMGILNLTPDSFSDGGDYFSKNHSLDHVQNMILEGADIIDVGAESTRPSADPISAEEEIKRLTPILGDICHASTKPISIDTYKAKTAEFALSCGVQIVNDVKGLLYDEDMASLIASSGAGIIIMHSLDIQKGDCDIPLKVVEGLSHSIEIALEAGVAEEQIALDIGIGFGKTFEQNLILLKNIASFKEMGFPLMVGASRKSFIGHYLKQDNPKDRVFGTLGVHGNAVSKGVDIVRVHDVAPHKQVFEMMRRIEDVGDK